MVTLPHPMLDTSLFENLPEPELRQVVAAARRRVFKRNEVVFHGGDPADTLHLIVRGRFASRVTTQTGDMVTVAVQGPGEAFKGGAIDHRVNSSSRASPGFRSRDGSDGWRTPKFHRPP